jgi:hypothetical protein
MGVGHRVFLFPHSSHTGYERVFDRPRFETDRDRHRRSRFSLVKDGPALWISSLEARFNRLLKWRFLGAVWELCGLVEL